MLLEPSHTNATLIEWFNKKNLLKILPKNIALNTWIKNGIEHLHSTIHEQFENEQCIFQYDSALFHKAKFRTKWLGKQNIWGKLPRIQIPSKTQKLW